MSFFERSARVPLIIRAPGRFVPRRVSRHVSLMDILPTLVELGACEDQRPRLPRELDGQSLVPVLQGRESGWPDTTLSEILCEGAIAPCFMIRRGRYKYVYSQPDPEQLYDLEADPNEVQNLAGQPPFDELRSAFHDEVMARWDPEAIHRAVIDSQRRRLLVHQALVTGRNASWDFQPFQDASQQYMRNHMALDDLERRARFPALDTPAPDGR